MRPLAGLRVLDISSGLAGAYCTKLLADAGADVVILEESSGNPLRRRTAFRRELRPGEDGALFQFLSAGKRSVIGRGESGGPSSAEATIDQLAELADVVVEDGGSRRGAELFARHPGCIVVTVTPFGLDGPWADAVASDLTLQALSSSIASRGERTRPPVSAGGEQIAWSSGAVGAVGILLALRRRNLNGAGEHIDVSELEVAVTIFNGFRGVAGQLATPDPAPYRGVEVPSVEPTADGWIGLCALSGPQFAGFAEMIGRPEWASDTEISLTDTRRARSAELVPLVDEWTRLHTSEDILTDATRRRIPAAPIGNGKDTPNLPHLVERKVFEEQPGSGFVRPRVPYLMSRVPPSPPQPSPVLGTTDVHEVADDWRARRAAASPPPTVPGAPSARPLAGIRVFDFTSFWAGPLASQVMAHFGADVIKVESVQRPDGTRMATSYGITGDLRWERAPLFQGVNTNKRGITLDLGNEEGLGLAKQLLAHCDVLIENYSPRVTERFGLLDDLRPDLIVVRMPAWGTTGPFRDAPGFAQNMEQASGLAWVTGHEDGPPIVPRGPCDPNGGLHAVFATIMAVLERDRTGLGQVVEASLVESALNVAAEQFVEFSAYGDLVNRMGNRSRHAAPHNVYACRSFEEWVAIAVTDDTQWDRLAKALGHPDWTADEDLATTEGRLRHRQVLDEALGAWCGSRTPEEVVAILWPAGVPVAPVVAPHAVVDLPPIQASDFYELVDHPVIGSLRVPRFPARFASGEGRGDARPAPMLGQHNHEVLVDLLGLTEEELKGLEATDVVGSRPLAHKL